MTRQIVKSITYPRKISLLVFPLDDHNVQILPLLGKVLLQLHPKTPVRKVVHQH
ncbi:MAG: hypothetical protein WCR46_07160 [Deltaproteobacteria bacterium]